MIQRRAHNRHAPVPTNYEPTVKRKSYSTKHVEEKPLKVSPYWMEVYSDMMRNFK